MADTSPTYPFIYIASLMRTGSTLLSELLTKLPYSMIFHEPHIGKNTFRVKAGDAELLRSQGFEIDAFLRYRLQLAFLQRRLRFLGYRQDFMAQQVKDVLIPRISSIAAQVGVKEIDNRGWQNYLKHFPEMKVLLTGRDPRDIYLSIYHKWQRGTLQRYQTVSPSRIAADLNRQFHIQLSLFRSADSLKIRYESLCTQRDLVEEIKRFVASPMQGIGAPGTFTITMENRADEAVLHGGRITARQTARWHHERNPDLLDEAEQVFDRMKAYRDFWGYP